MTKYNVTIEEIDRARTHTALAYDMYTKAVDDFLDEETKARLWDIYASFRKVYHGYYNLSLGQWQAEASDVGFGPHGRPL